MTEADLASLRCLARAATPGPWRAGTFERYHVYAPHDGMGPERVLLRLNEHFEHEADAAFIAALSPGVVVELVRLASRASEVERSLREVEAQLRQAGDVVAAMRAALRPDAPSFE